MPQVIMAIMLILSQAAQPVPQSSTSQQHVTHPKPADVLGGPGEGTGG